MSTISGTIITNGGLTGTITIGGGSAPVLETATVKSTNVEQTIVPQEGVDGFNEIVVQAVESEDNLPAVMFGTETAPTIASPDAQHKTFIGLANVTAITLSDATAISNNAFKNMSKLENISAPDCLSIGANAFEKCRSLASVNFPAVTTIGNNAFYNAFDENESVALSFPSATTIGVQILQDSNAVSISLPAVTSLPDNALQWAHKLTSISLPECISLGNSALNGCGFSSITLPKVQTMGREQFNDNDYVRDIYLGYDGVVAVTKEEHEHDYRLFSGGLSAVTIHVPSSQLSAYQADVTWTAIVAESANDNTTVTFAGDYA